jgi:hypothetical protein
LNTDTLQAQQKDFSESFVNTIMSRLQNRRPVDTEALVVGSDGENAQIYLVDAYGNDTCLDGVGFGAIGIGGWHAKSRMMQAGHVSSRVFPTTLAVLYTAKKNSEIAPGVGKNTDMHVVLKDGVFPLWDHVPPELGRLYSKYMEELSKLGESLITELDNFMANWPEPAPADDKVDKEAFGKDAASAASNGSSLPNVAQAES